MNYTKTYATLGNVDIYLIDQILKNRYAPNQSLLDAGCGEGRNLKWFCNNNYSVSGIDRNEERLKTTQLLYPNIAERFQLGTLESLPYDENSFDHIICCAVLHFVKNKKEFNQCFAELVRVLKSGGSLFIRINSEIGIEKSITHIGNGVYRLPDETERFLLNRKLLKMIMSKHKLSFLEPLKTTNVADLRAMSTIVLTKL